MTTVAVLGTGYMGGPMARNLLKAGHRLKAFDLSAPVLKTVVEAGATAAASADDAAKDVEVVITMLPALSPTQTVSRSDGRRSASPDSRIQ